MWPGFAEVFAVILINLLPHREAARKLKRDIFNVTLGASAVFGGVIAGIVFLWYQNAISMQQESNMLLTTEIKMLESQITDIAGLEAEITALRARQQAVEDLQADRNLPVHLLTELVNQLPDGVYITKMVQVDQQVTLNGVAQSNERVSEFLRNLGNNTPWFRKPDLIEIVAGTVALSPREQKRVANFVVKVGLVRSSEAEKVTPTPVGAASSALTASPASGVAAPEAKK
jgi:type IV pilus assembly protein PilN